MISSPAVSGGVVYIGSIDGNLYALGSPLTFNATPDRGDGATSPEKDPVHTYTEAGNYTVKLSVTNSAGRLIVEKPGYIHVGVPLAPGWRFHADLRDSGVYDGGGTHQDNTVRWNFTTADWISSTPAVVDGIAYFGSEDYNLYAVDTYTGKEQWRFKTGSYIHSSPAVTAGVVYIGSQDHNLYAIGNPLSFNGSTVTGPAPLTVKCTDKSVGNPTTIVYDFGDGINVTGPNPTHIYRFPGVYTITLPIMKYNTTSYPIMGSTATKPGVITVNSVPQVPLCAKFVASPLNGTAPLTVRFTDQSTGSPTFLNYDFGDGINASGKNPVHTYRFPGIYNVTLSIFRSDSNSGSMLGNMSVQKDYIVVQGK